MSFSDNKVNKNSQAHDNFDRPDINVNVDSDIYNSNTYSGNIKNDNLLC